MVHQQASPVGDGEVTVKRVKPAQVGKVSASESQSYLWSPPAGPHQKPTCPSVSGRSSSSSSTAAERGAVSEAR